MFQKLLWETYLYQFFNGINERAEKEAERVKDEIAKSLTDDPVYLQRQVLALLGFHYVSGRGLTFTEIKEELHTTSSRLTRILSTLQNKGLISRRVIKRLPRTTEYRLAATYVFNPNRRDEDEALRKFNEIPENEKNLVLKAIEYGMYETSSITDLEMIVFLRESLITHLKALKDQEFVREVKEKWEETVKFLTDNFYLINWMTALCKEDEREDFDQLIRRTAETIVGFYLEPEKIKSYYENLVRKHLIESLGLLIRETIFSGREIILEEIEEIEEISEKSRGITPLLVYNFTKIKILNSILELIGKSKKERLKIYSDCAKFVAKNYKPVNILKKALQEVHKDIQTEMVKQRK